MNDINKDNVLSLESILQNRIDPPTVYGLEQRIIRQALHEKQPSQLYIMIEDSIRYISDSISELFLVPKPAYAIAISLCLGFGFGIFMGLGYISGEETISSIDGFFSYPEALI